MTAPQNAIIDVHVHTYPSAETGVRAQGGRGLAGASGTAEEFVALAQNRIITAVLTNITPVAEMMTAGLNRGASDAETRATVGQRLNRRNAWTVQCASEKPLFVASVQVDPNVLTEAELLAEIERHRRDGARGITLHPANQKVYPNDRRLWPVYDLAQSLGMSVFAASGYGLLPGTDDFGRPVHFSEPLSDFPRLTFVLGHLGWKYWDEPPSLAKSHANVYFDTSFAISVGKEPPDLTDAEAAALIQDIGAERVLFGSDWPWRDPLADARRIEGLPLPASDISAILYTNAANLISRP